MKEYKSSETTIQQAMIDMAKSHPDKKSRPGYILFDGFKVKTSLSIKVPINFKVRLEFLSPPDLNQGADIRVDGGYLLLEDGSKIKLLRTWHDPQYEPVVEYFGHSKTGTISVYNVYKVMVSGQAEAEKWTNNAGMIVEQNGDTEFILRCSSGANKEANFNDFTFKVNLFG